MMNTRYPEHLVFGLDIGTRSLVGTVGYKQNEKNFIVIAQCVKEHDTRAMLDGQIHDIVTVSESIESVKRSLEKQIGRKLTEVCIAAAGRVLKTVVVRADYEFLNETIVLDEHIHSLDLLGIEKAYEKIKEEMQGDVTNFYCVGYSAIRYYLNDYAIMKLEGHKASKISTELLATFLPYEVIDGLYSAVERAGLNVANLTLEPIAAINVAIPDNFRLLNIALVDVGAGTSDISITKDGSIIAYGMIPYAGDEITEVILQKCLVDFNTAERIKQNLKKKTISYKDIMGLTRKVSSSEILEEVDPTIQKITKSIADKIIELNGDKSVSAVFVVGGGGKVPAFTKALADHLKITPDRVALRGEEVLRDVEFLQSEIKKDPLLVTPIGICLNYYDQKNNFIFVHVNEDRVKLYDNSKLTIVDAAMQVGFPNEKLFPRRGKPIHYTLNGNKKTVRGELGEAAIITLNGKVVGMNTPIAQHDIINITESTVGADAVFEVSQLPEYSSTIEFVIDSKKVICPKFVMANDKLVSEFYSIKDGDQIKILNYYTLEQVLEFMDIAYTDNILVNNKPAVLTTKIYENFSIDHDWDIYLNRSENELLDFTREQVEDTVTEDQQGEDIKSFKGNSNVIEPPNIQKTLIHVTVNGETVKLSKKSSYILVDILDVYQLDLTAAKNGILVMEVNGITADFTTAIQDNDRIEIYWKG